MPAADRPLLRLSPRAVGVGSAVITVLVWTGFIVISRATAGRALIETAGTRAEETLNHELKRLEDLGSRNPQITPAEISSLRRLRDESLNAIDFPRLRLDALRLVWCM